MRNPAYLTLAALLTVYLFWGSAYIATRFTLEGGFTPFWLGAMRYLLVGGFLYAVLRFCGIAAPTRKQWLNCLVLGITILAIGNGLVFFAQARVSSGIASVAIASLPLWIAFFATLHGDRPNRAEMLGLLLGFAGIVLLNIGGELSAQPAGFFALLIAPVPWAYSIIWSHGRDLPAPFMTAAAQMLAGGFVMLLIALMRGERFAALPTFSGRLAFAYLTVFCSLLTYTVYIWLMANSRPILLGSSAYVNPVVALSLGVWLANEQIGGKDFVAALLILAAVLLMSLAKYWRKPSLNPNPK